MVVLIFVGAFACFGAGCTQQEQSILTGATTLAAAVASIPLPADVASTPTGQAIGYWSSYAAGLLAAVNKASTSSTTSASTATVTSAPASTTTVNPTPAQ
jgi:hypothetical protein